MQLIRLNASRQPNTISMWVVGSMIVCYCLLSFALGGTIIYGWDAIANGETWALVVTILLATFLVIFCILISIQPRQKFLNHVKPFKVYCPRHFHILSSASMKRFSFLGSLGAFLACSERFRKHLLDVDARLLHVDSFRNLDDSW